MARPTKHEARYKNVGRKSVMTKDILQKLEDAFTIGASDIQACYHAGISKQTLYNYQKKNPKFIDRKESLKEHVSLAAKMNIAKSITESKALPDSWRWLEKRDTDFVPTQKVEHTGSVTMENIPMTPKMQEAIKLYNEARKEQIVEEIDAMP